MEIEYVNGYWVPANDIHIDKWKSGQPFTQNKGLNKFIEYLDRKDLKFKTVLDVGAWCGTWSNEMSKYAEDVHAFEPDDLHFQCLLKNKKENVTPHQCAVGSQKAKVSLVENEKNFTQEKRVVPEGDILMTTVDSFAIKDVDLIKIDVEGYEPKILKGMTNLIRKSPFAKLIMEIDPKILKSINTKQQIDQLNDQLMDLGFMFAIICEDNYKYISMSKDNLFKTVEGHKNVIFFKDIYI